MKDFFFPKEMYFAKFRSLLNLWLLCTTEKHNFLEFIGLQILPIFSYFSANTCSFGLARLVL